MKKIGMGASAQGRHSIAAVVTTADGRDVDLGVITSPYDDPIRNALWKQRKFKKHCKALGRMDRYHPLFHLLPRAVPNESGQATVYTSVGKNWVSDKCRDAGAGAGLVATSAEVPNRVGWGTGAGTAAVGDTTLFTEASEARALATLTGVTTTVTGDTLQGVGTITADATKTITNAGWFTATTGADMIGKGDFAGVPVVLNDAIEFTWKLQQS